jgi:hypothetical protein
LIQYKESEIMMENDDSHHYAGARLSVTVGATGQRIHMLIDDTQPMIRANLLQIRRDPMVEALFGSAKRKKPRKNGEEHVPGSKAGINPKPQNKRANHR